MKYFLALILTCSSLAFAVDPRSFMPVKITSQDAATDADVTTTGGKNRLEVNTTYTDVSPTNGSITALDTGTSALVGANGQTFYFGTPTTNSAAVFSIANINMVSIQANILGGGGTLVVEASMDGGTSWLRPNVFQLSTQSYTNGFTAPFIAILNVTGMTQFRVRTITSWSGTATIIVKESINQRAFTLADALPPGANSIGSVAQSGTWTTGRTWTLSSGTDSIAAVQSGTWNINNISGTISLPTGASTAANQSTMQTTLNAIDAGIPAALGQTNMSASMPVAIASDQTKLPVKALLTSGGVFGNVAIGTTATEIKVGASRLTGRCNVAFVVIDTNTCYYGEANTVTSSNGIPVAQSQIFNFDIDANGQIWVICTVNTKNARVAERPC